MRYYEKQRYNNIYHDVERISNLIAKNLTGFKIKKWVRHIYDRELKYKIYKIRKNKLFGLIPINKEYAYCSIKIVCIRSMKFIEIVCHNEIVEKVEKIISGINSDFIKVYIILVDAGNTLTDEYDTTNIDSACGITKTILRSF